MMAGQALLGIGVFCLLAWALSENRKGVRWEIVAWGLLLQFILALLLLKVPGFSDVLAALAAFFDLIADATKVGTSFVFGWLGGADTPFTVTTPNNMFIFAINPLMTVFIIAALANLLWYWGWLPRALTVMARLFQSTMRVSGPVAFAGCANVFFAMTEVMVMIRPTLAKMSRAELLQMMTVGMTTIAGSMFVIYAQFLDPLVPNSMVHVLTASFLHLPAGLVMAYLLLPHQPVAEGQSANKQAAKSKAPKLDYAPSTATSSLDAFFEGALNGIPVVVNCVVVLIATLAALHLIDAGIGGVFGLVGVADMTLAKLLAPVFAPLTWLMGVPLAETLTAGALLGTKTVVNEFVAIANMTQLPAGSLSPGAALAMSYALISFANFATAGIMSAALYAIAPERRHEVPALAMKCVLSGLLATCCTGSVIAIFYAVGLV